MHLGSNPMPRVFATSLGQYGTEVMTPQYGSGTVRGVRVQWASGVVRYGSNAHVGILTVYVATYHQHTYLAALGIVDTGDDASSIGGREYQEGQNILNTLRFR